MEAVNHIQLSIPRALAPVTLRALIYAILFQRNMEAVEPQTFDALDAAVVCAPNEAIEKEIRSKLDEFGREYLEPRATKGELAVVFLQKRPRKGWFATTEELVPWELHLITLNFTSPPPSTDRYGAPAVRQPTSAPSLVPALTQILMFCADKRHAVPPLGGADSGLSHQIMVNPPPASDLFSPSPPLPARSPPPVTTTTLATATLQARDTAHVPSSRSSAANELREARGERGNRDRGETERGERGDRDRDRSGRADRMDRRGGSSGPPAGSAAVGTGTGSGYSNPLRGYGYNATSASAAGQAQGQATSYGQQTQGPDGHPQYQHHHQHDAQGQGGYLDAAKDGLRAVRAGAGAVAHWAGRGR